MQLHGNKIIMRKFSQGIDFLGYVILSHHLALRTKTKRRIFKKMRALKLNCDEGKISESSFNQSLQSYLGVLSHANAHRLGEDIRNGFGYNISIKGREERGTI